MYCSQDWSLKPTEYWNHTQTNRPMLGCISLLSGPCGETYEYIFLGTCLKLYKTDYSNMKMTDTVVTTRWKYPILEKPRGVSDNA